MDKEILTGVIAACAALAGVIVSQSFSLLLSHVERTYQKRVLLRTKYEELVSHLNDSLVWANSMIEAKTFDELGVQPISARRIYALVLLYFPLLRPQAEAYLQASLDFQSAVSDAFRPVGASAGADAIKHNPEALSVAGTQFQAARQALDMQIERCAGIYIAA
jgi:hypothetical protein